MIARTEEEFDRYQIMDVERRRAETVPGVKTKPRLGEDEDLPPWLLKDDDEVCTCERHPTSSGRFNPVSCLYSLVDLVLDTRSHDVT